MAHKEAWLADRDIIVDGASVEGNIIRFRCHTGHGYSSSALLEDVEESV